MFNLRLFKVLLTGSFFLLTLMACERNVDQENIDDEEVAVGQIIDLEDHEEASDYIWDDSEITPVILSGTSISTEGEGLTINGSTGTLVHIQDQDGKEILNFEPPKSFDSMAFSSSELVSGSTYTIYLGGSHSGTAVDGIYEDGTYTSDTMYSSFTVLGTISYVN